MIQNTYITILQAMYERQGVAVVPPTLPSGPQGAYLDIPKGAMKRQKSIGKQDSITFCYIAMQYVQKPIFCAII